MSTLVSALLRRRARTAGAEPLLTYYQPAAGTRVELSAITLLNWVDKTSHLLDELDVAAGDTVDLALALGAPGHWVTAVWELACWQVGAVVAVGRPASDTGLLVTGPDWADHVGGPASELVACSLHPLGLPLAGELPPGVLDYSLEVRGQADVYPAVAQQGSAPAWRDAERQLSQDDLVAGAFPRERRLVRPGGLWPTAHAALVAALVGGGSTVVVDGVVADEQLARIAEQERAVVTEVSRHPAVSRSGGTPG